jgi:hypothetical protein
MRNLIRKTSANRNDSPPLGPLGRRDQTYFDLIPVLFLVMAAVITVITVVVRYLIGLLR